MKCSAQRKCKHCSEFYFPDRRNVHHQRYCSEPACRKQSKAESQRRWLQKPDNQNYFCGSHNSQRVKACSSPRTTAIFQDPSKSEIFPKRPPYFFLPPPPTSAFHP